MKFTRAFSLHAEVLRSSQGNTLVFESQAELTAVFMEHGIYLKELQTIYGYLDLGT